MNKKIPDLTILTSLIVLFPQPQTHSASLFPLSSVFLQFCRNAPSLFFAFRFLHFQVQDTFFLDNFLHNNNSVHQLLHRKLYIHIFFNLSIVSEIFVTFTISTCSIAPVDDFTTVSVTFTLFLS